MALSSLRPVFCQLRAEKASVPETQKLMKVVDRSNAKPGIVLQPRVCTLRSFGEDRGGATVIKGVVVSDYKNNEVVVTNTGTAFFEILSDYIESTRRSQDFEIITGRLAMIVFAATVSMEVLTGNSVFRKMDLIRIEEAGGVCMAAITSAAIFALLSSNRNSVGRIFTVGCNTFVDSLIDNIVNGLFYDIDISDWSDEI